MTRHLLPRLVHHRQYSGVGGSVADQLGRYSGLRDAFEGDLIFVAFFCWRRIRPITCSQRRLELVGHSPVPDSLDSFA